MRTTLFYICSLATILSVYSCKEPVYSSGKNPITLESLMEEMVSVEAEPCFPVPFFTTKHVSSYDRRSVIPGTPSWHANRDNTGFVRYEANNGRVEKVLFDEKGPGVLTRILTTGGSDGANLRIYFDGEKEASILLPAYDISLFPLDIPEGLLYKHEHYSTTQGSSFYYPLPYAQSCKITVDNVDRDYFFHTSCRTYPKGTKVQTFTLKDGEALQDKAQKLSEQLMYPKTYTENPETKEARLTARSSLRMKLPDGEKAIRSLSIHVSETDSTCYASFMRNMIVKISFDGVQTVCETVSAYAAAKGGLKMLTRNICSEYGEYNIQCNGIGPGYIATPQTAPLREKQADGSRHPFDSFICAKTPAGRWLDPEELTGPAVFLASEASNAVNGHILYVDGGILAYIGKQPK